MVVNFGKNNGFLFELFVLWIKRLFVERLRYVGDVAFFAKNIILYEFSIA